MRILAVFLVVGLTGCSALTEKPDYQALDDEECRSMGLSFGTPEYSDCRLRLVELREARKRAAIRYLQANPLKDTTPKSNAIPQPTSRTECRTVGTSVQCTTYE